MCRKWRNVVFGSSRRLGLKLFCNARTPVGKSSYGSFTTKSGTTIASLQHSSKTIAYVSELDWQDDIESSQWLEPLHPFTGVKDFHIPRDFAPRIAPVMRELVKERVTELLFSALETLFPRRHTHRPSSILLPHDSLPVTPFLFLGVKSECFFID